MLWLRQDSQLSRVCSLRKLPWSKELGGEVFLSSFEVFLNEYSRSAEDLGNRALISKESFVSGVEGLKWENAPRSSYEPQPSIT
jgi:hypothetical protein